MFPSYALEIDDARQGTTRDVDIPQVVNASARAKIIAELPFDKRVAVIANLIRGDYWSLVAVQSERIFRGRSDGVTVEVIDCGTIRPLPLYFGRAFGYMPHSTKFGWGRPSQECRQLAFAMLREASDPESAEQVCDELAFSVLAHLIDNRPWLMSESMVRALAKRFGVVMQRQKELIG